jgi:hypothetical protein
MKKKVVCLLSLVLCLGIAVNAMAESVSWTNGGGDLLWSNGANWQSGSVPGADDSPWIGGNFTSATGPIINSSMAPSVTDLAVGGGGESTSDVITMTGGTLTTSSWLMCGCGSINKGTFNLSGGTVNMSGCLFIGYGGIGILNMSGGDIETSGIVSTGDHYGTTSQLNMTAGTINARGYIGFGVWGSGVVGNLNMSGGKLSTITDDGRLYFGLEGTSESVLSGGEIDCLMLGMSAGSHLKITDTGTLIIKGINALEDNYQPGFYGMNSLIGVEWLYTDAGQTLQAVYNGTDTIVSVPEPATLCILGLGCLGALLRRNK